jgi:NADPH:quinone reductase-like Zn-dependent oxidoreductase
MKAIVFAETGGPEVLTLADAPQPSARPGSVLIKNQAIGVNFETRASARAHGEAKLPTSREWRRRAWWRRSARA